jgi:hypothetical protein
MARTHDEKPAAAIAYHGEIWTDGRGWGAFVGQGIHDGQRHAFLLAPSPLTP